MSLDYAKVNEFIAENVVRIFYENRMHSLRVLRLERDILRNKNPYLFKTKDVETPEEFVRAALDAYLSSSEETMFGNLMENLAIYVCGLVFKGKKAMTKVMKSVV